MFSLVHLMLLLLTLCLKFVFFNAYSSSETMPLGGKIMEKKKRNQGCWQRFALMVARWSIAGFYFLFFFQRLWGQFCSDSDMHEMVDLLRCTQDQFLPTLCFVFLNSLLAMHNCRWKGKKNIVDNFSCVSARSINTFFFFAFFFFLWRRTWGG